MKQQLHMYMQEMARTNSLMKMAGSKSSVPKSTTSSPLISASQGKSSSSSPASAAAENLPLHSIPSMQKDSDGISKRSPPMHGNSWEASNDPMWKKSTA